MVELQNLGLSARLEHMALEISRLRAAYQEPRPVGASPMLNDRRISTLEHAQKSLLNEMVERQNTATRPVPPPPRIISYQQFIQALNNWAPAYSGMTIPAMAMLLACKVGLLPSLAVARAFQEALEPYADLAVFYAQPSWVVPGQAINSDLLRCIRGAVSKPCELHIVVYDGLNCAGLQTWARSLKHWAQGLASLPEFPGQRWPRNLRLYFVPEPGTQLTAIPAVGLAALPPLAQPDKATFKSIDWGGFVDSWDDVTAEPAATHKRLNAALTKLGQSKQAESWQERLLASWPELYRKEGRASTPEAIRS
jgi:hypothetical protein